MGGDSSSTFPTTAEHIVVKVFATSAARVDHVSLGQTQGVVERSETTMATDIDTTPESDPTRTIPTANHTPAESETVSSAHYLINDVADDLMTAIATTAEREAGTTVSINVTGVVYVRDLDMFFVSDSMTAIYHSCALNMSSAHKNGRCSPSIAPPRSAMAPSLLENTIFLRLAYFT